MHRATMTGEILKERYEVLQRIGHGGMADVYRGWDMMLCRDIAIKVLKPERINEAMKKRVLREARASCAVDHPHMLRVTDMGFVGEAPYLVTDLLRGASLADVLERSPDERLDWRYALGLLLPAMDALHAAHEACLVHRDIKPENLFLHRRGAAEVLMVLDLGLVKFTDSEGKPTPRWTQSGMIMGTALYLSPEQANAAPVDRRSDVYSMGVTLYRVLTGQHLFPPEPGDGPFSALTRHIFEPPPRMCDRTFPLALVDAVHTALAKDSTQRHATMQVFAQALHRCLADAAPTIGAARARDVWSSVGRTRHVTVGLVLGAALAVNLARVEAPESAAGSVDPSPAAVLPTPEAAMIAGDEAVDLCLPREPPDAAVPEDVDAEDPGSKVNEPTRQPPAPRPTGRRSSLMVAVEPPVVSAIDPLPRMRGAVHRCVRDFGDLEATALTVRVTLRADDSVESVGIGEDADASLLTACVGDRLSQLRFAPGSPRTVEHAYHFNRGEIP